MARKILGYIELVWTCDSCGTKNPGAIKACTNCGAPQPIQVRFERVDANTFNFIKDEALLRMAKSGPDKHCPFCGTRNLAEATRCEACGADITVGATSRPSGDVIESFDPSAAKPVIAPGAQPAGLPNEKRASLPKGALIAIIIIGLILCVLGTILLINLTRTNEVNATVSSVAWQRSIKIENYQLVSNSTWQSDLPTGADIGSCSLKYRYNSDSPKPESTEVCGTPYTVDTGTGIGQVVQDCYYQVYENYCSYTEMAWVPFDTLVSSGNDLNPVWPTANLSQDQRFSDQSEKYTIDFVTSGTNYSLTTSDLNLYLAATPGSQWVLEVNKLGKISSAEPVK